MFLLLTSDFQVEIDLSMIEVEISKSEAFVEGIPKKLAQFGKLSL